MCHVYWPNAGSWFAARVAEVNRPQQSITIQYEGDRTDVLELSKEDKFFKVRSRGFRVWGLGQAL